MIEGLETLAALRKLGSMVSVATSLRLSQSAVSKRIAALEQSCGYQLVEREGRNVRLSHQAVSLLEKVEPLLGQLRDAVEYRAKGAQPHFRIGVSESVLSSWGADTLLRAIAAAGIRGSFHCHRSPLVAEYVDAGRYDLGVCAGQLSTSRGLLSELLLEEEMILVAKPKMLARALGECSLIGIEKNSATWKSIKPSCNERGLVFDDEVESFFSVAQLAMAGRGVGLVPCGVADALKVGKKSRKVLRPSLSRPVQLIYKKSKLESKHFQALLGELRTT